jgi:aspartyl-tRNA(Asn)/glutamyl-tRNA(Gln) amidotransferase subunit B
MFLANLTGYSLYFNIISMIDQNLIKTVANIITNQLITISVKNNKDLENLISKENIIELATLFNDSKINNQGLSKAIEILVQNPEFKLSKVLEENKLMQITDTSALQLVVDAVLVNNLPQVEQYKAGKTNVIGFLVGQCMKQAGGNGNPKIFSELLTKKLEI